jgi:hypothetical protein
MVDALAIVRQATLDGTPIKYEDGNYIIGSHRFPETTKTIFKRTLKSESFSVLQEPLSFLMINLLYR